MKTTSVGVTLTSMLSSSGRLLPSYWLTLEQIEKDDKVSRAEVAKLVDTLYGIEPCEQVKEKSVHKDVTSDTRTPVYITNLDLMAAAHSTLDIAECQKKKDGTYRAYIRVTRSHEELPYKLKLAYGSVLKTTVHKEDISVVVDVSGASSTVLKNPVLSKPLINGRTDPDELAAEWLLPVYGNRGVLDNPPDIMYGLLEMQKDGKYKHVDKNLLHWGVNITGSIRVVYETWYEIVEVEIPGIPSNNPGILGTSREKVPITAFYHGQPYDGEVSPPANDETANQKILRDLCLPGDPINKDGDLADADGDDEEDADKSPYPQKEYGCQSYIPIRSDPSYYLDKCCVDGAPPRGDCGLFASRRPADKKLDQKLIDKMTGEWDGPIEFIGVGPCAGVSSFGDEGCGTLYTRVKVLQKSCCDDVEPLSWDMDVTPDVLPHDSSIIIAWTGGGEVTVTTSSNGTYFADGRKSVTGHGTSIELFAGETFCGATQVTVRDGCSEASVLIRSDIGQWRYIGNVCILPDVENQDADFSGSWSAISGNYKQLESTSWAVTNFMATNIDNCGELPGLCGTPGETCLKLSAAAGAVPCTGDGAPLGTGSYRCGRSGVVQRRYDPYANHSYTRFFTTSLSAYRWGC